MYSAAEHSPYRNNISPGLQYNGCFSHGCDQIPNRNNFRVERFVLAYSLRDTVCDGIDGVEEGACNHIESTVKKHRRDQGKALLGRTIVA